ncbi:spore gernimation protein GerQ [Bacillus sp. FJAT-18017]|uniref:spore coat protein n=1 Tax=Bacillus sp. FJAT-18017 TaxID=1705566 RepID=UPI0006B04A18|nr:spore coat protein [Bacillus sp. FJAT-18017]ALC90371.1 spore gernimation protein GerQ [Bacillus sp. FJAT-18017]
MNQLLQNLIGMGGMTDQVIAMDFLITSKSGIRNLAAVITETGTPEVRAALKEQLHDAIQTHTAISEFMTAKGYYYPTDLSKQFQLDLSTSETALTLGQKMQ